MKEHNDAFRQRVMATGVADRCNRIRRLDQDWRKLQRIQEDRARHYHLAYRKALKALEEWDEQQTTDIFIRAVEVLDAWESREKEPGERPPADVLRARNIVAEPDLVRWARRFKDLYEGTPGIQTGLITRSAKASTTEYIVDTELLGELRAIEQRAAKELGQERDVLDLNASIKAYVGFDPEEMG